MANIVTKVMFDYVIKGTQKQVDRMYDLYDRELYRDKEFKKYFHILTDYETGVYMIPREKFFVSHNGDTSYVVALLNMVGVDKFDEISNQPIAY